MIFYIYVSLAVFKSLRFAFPFLSLLCYSVLLCQRYVTGISLLFLCLKMFLKIQILTQNWSLLSLRNRMKSSQSITRFPDINCMGNKCIGDIIASYFTAQTSIESRAALFSGSEGSGRRKQNCGWFYIEIVLVRFD